MRDAAPDSPPLLLAVPNISEGRDETTIAAVADAFAAAGARVLDIHRDGDHHRSVYTLAGRPGALADAVAAGVAVAVQRIDISDGRGQHPHVGAVDVAPIVHLCERDRGAAIAEALVLADTIAERLHVPVLLYGELGGGRHRAALRRGGAAALAERVASGEMVPDFGPARLHPTAGATLLAARPPLIAFNLELAPPAGIAEARRIACLIREGGAEGLPGLRAIGVALRDGGIGQVSMNVERPCELPLRAVVEAVRRHAPVTSAELVGLAPRAAFDGFPADLPIPGFDPARHLLENALGF